MFFLSTHNPKSRISFKEAVFQGLAPDGGLYLPVITPELTSVFEKFNSSSSFLEVASKTTAALFSDEMRSDIAERICKRAFTFSPKLDKRKDNLYLLELFHGPSCAFKDFGASFLASAIEEFLKTDHRKAVILTATSGDTGSAGQQCNA